MVNAMKTTAAAIIISVFILAFSGCSSKHDNVKDFLDTYLNQNYEQLYDSAAGRISGAMSGSFEYEMIDPGIYSIKERKLDGGRQYSVKCKALYNLRSKYISGASFKLTRYLSLELREDSRGNLWVAQSKQIIIMGMNRPDTIKRYATEIKAGEALLD